MRSIFFQKCIILILSLSLYPNSWSMEKRKSCSFEQMPQDLLLHFLKGYLPDGKDIQALAKTSKAMLLRMYMMSDEKVFSQVEEIVNRLQMQEMDELYTRIRFPGKIKRFSTISITFPDMDKNKKLINHITTKLDSFLNMNGRDGNSIILLTTPQELEQELNDPKTFKEPLYGGAKKYIKTYLKLLKDEGARFLLGDLVLMYRIKGIDACDGFVVGYFSKEKNENEPLNLRSCLRCDETYCYGIYSNVHFFDAGEDLSSLVNLSIRLE